MGQSHPLFVLARHKCQVGPDSFGSWEIAMSLHGAANGGRVDRQAHDGGKKNQGKGNDLSEVGQLYKLVANG